MSSGKHQTYFELREALERPACVVCRLSARSVRRYLEALSFESVNDYGLRTQLRRARGFCNLHAWQLVDEVRDPFGAGIIYRDVLNHCLGLVQAGKPTELAPERGCLACEARAGAEARYVDVVGEHLAEEAFAGLVQRAGGLCWRHFALGVARGGRGLRRLAEVEVAALQAGLGGGAAGGLAKRDGRPAPGVRAGNAAPRPAPDEVVGDAVVAAAVGLPGVTGVAAGELEAREWGSGPLGGGGRGGVDGGDEECGVCRSARAAVGASIERMAQADAAPLELCAPHAWRAVERVGAEVVRGRLRPALEHLMERIAEAAGEFDRAAPVGVGRLEVTLPAARRVRGELALRLAPGPGCAVCAAQLAAEEEALGGRELGLLCRPHLMASGRMGRALTLSQEERGRWGEIVADLDEYIRKNDYRFRDEPRGPEQRAPWRAVAMVAGARDVR